MVPPRRTRVVFRRWSPYRDSVTRYRALKHREYEASIAESDAIYACAMQELQKLPVKKEKPSTLGTRPIRRTRTTWYDLPNEILLEIARHYTVPTCDDAHRIQNHPASYDIDISFSRVNRACRQAFFECISKNFVIAQLRLCKGPERPFAEAVIEDSLLKLFNCRNIQKLLAHLVSTNRHRSMAFIQIDMQQQQGYRECAAAEVLVLLEKENTLLLQELMQFHVPTFPFLEISCWYGARSSSRILADAACKLMSLLRGVKYGILRGSRLADHKWRFGHHLQKTGKPILEGIKSEELRIQHKLNILQEQRGCDEFEPPELHIMVVWLILQRHIKSLEEIRIPLHILHASVRVFGYFQRGLAYWLFSKPNNQTIQSRFLLENDGNQFQIVEKSLHASVEFRTRVRNTDLKQIDDWVYFGDLVRLLISYAALELALARALLSGHHSLSCVTSSLEARLRCKPIFLQSIRSISMDYIMSAGDTLDILRQLRDGLSDQPNFLRTVNYEQFLLWFAEAENYAIRIRTAYVQNSILVHPMRQLERNGRL